MWEALEENTVIQRARNYTTVKEETAQMMTEAARTFLVGLEPEQRKRVLFPLNSAERLNWDYRPKPRKGVPLKEMDSSQQQLAYALLASGLSRSGNSKALNIMSLEKVLKALEGGTSSFTRDPLLYYVSLFGEPSHESAWGWRLEGHHVSVNFLLVKSREIAPTPNFFGANPAHVFHGPLKGLRVLSDEEDQARRLLTSLDRAAQNRAIIAEEAPADIVTRWEPRVRMDDPAGLAASQMTEDQQKLLMKLVSIYTNRLPREAAAKHLNRIEKEGKGHVHFAWAGSAETGKPHYYRLHGPSLLIEYDNTQDKANHIHSVWRDPRNDWGDDLLKEHYTRAHEGLSLHR